MLLSMSTSVSPFLYVALSKLHPALGSMITIPCVHSCLPPAVKPIAEPEATLTSARAFAFGYVLVSAKSTTVSLPGMVPSVSVEDSPTESSAATPVHGARLSPDMSPNTMLSTKKTLVSFLIRLLPPLFSFRPGMDTYEYVGSLRILTGLCT